SSTPSPPKSPAANAPGAPVTDPPREKNAPPHPPLIHVRAAGGSAAPANAALSAVQTLGGARWRVWRSPTGRRSATEALPQVRDEKRKTCGEKRGRARLRASSLAACAVRFLKRWCRGATELPMARAPFIREGEGEADAVAGDHD